ncbi:Metalloprotease [Xylaria digitata]|nr:Metalloprotease [Xylaria digitata]
MSSDEKFPHFCAQRYLPTELAQDAIRVAIEENPDNFNLSPGLSLPPAGGSPPARGMGPPISATPGEEAVGSRLGLFTGKRWRPGKTLRVRFLSGGTRHVRERVKQYANMWSMYANIHFQFVEAGDSEIRIVFLSNSASWSYIGTDALAPALKGKATMQYGWFDDKTPEDEFSRTILHEFGHALGCVHEHSQPNSDIQWNKPLVIASYYREQGWSPDQVEHNVFYRYSFADGIRATGFDATSIMEYPIPPEFTTNGFTAGRNAQLSTRDIEFIRRMYPWDARPSGVPASNLETGVFNTLSDASPSAASSGCRTIVNFSKSYPSPPKFIVGLNFLDFGNSRNLRIKSRVEMVRPRQARLKLQSWADTTQHASGIAWLLFPSEDKDFQSGTFTANAACTGKTVVFDREYPSLPKVLVFFSSLNIDQSTNCRVRTYASEVTTRSFKLNVETWSNTRLLEGEVSWIALPADKQGIVTGTFSAGEEDTTRPSNQGKVVFNQSFTKAPKIFLALSMVDADMSTQTRVRLSANSDLSGKQMEWHIDSWGNSSSYGAEATYIAIDS